MIFHCKVTHTPENCGLRAPEKTQEAVEKMKKYAIENGMKIHGVYTNTPNHEIYLIVDTDKAEHLHELFLPLTLSSNTEIVPVCPMNI